MPGSLCSLTFLMTLFDWNVPLSVLGRWCGVHKTTVLRWVLGLALALWPVVAQWIVERVKAPMVYVDEKWLKLRGAGTTGLSSWMCTRSYRYWPPGSRRAASGPVAGLDGNSVCSRKYPRSSSRMDYRLMPTWRQARNTSCVAFITSRV